MQSTRWLNRSQPQTLVNACLLLYITAAFDLLFGFGFLGGVSILLIGAKVGAGWGIANERKWGYGAGVAVAALTLLPLVLYVIANGRLPFGLLIANAFDILLLVLLLHTQSRQYQRIWFR